MTKPTIKLYQELQNAFDYFNEHLFDNKLPNVIITLQRNENICGQFISDSYMGGGVTSEISLNPDLFGPLPIFDTLATLAHEMCHVWRHYIPATPSEGDYHDSQWADKMESIGLTPTDTGKVGGNRTGQYVTHFITEGGRFETVVFDLLKSGFNIPYYSTYNHDAIIESNTDLSIIKKWIAKAGSCGILEAKVRFTLSPFNPFNDLADLNRNLYCEFGQVFAESRGGAPKPTQIQTKYNCQYCGFTAKAKPSANLICGDCNEIMQQT